MTEVQQQTLTAAIASAEEVRLSKLKMLNAALEAAKAAKLSENLLIQSLPPLHDKLRGEINTAAIGAVENAIRAILES
ncbi:MAG TPA: hypothetical protein VGM05_26930 [Planctomycetaceae bacterium]|jgi:hypothetical protein